MSSQRPPDVDPLARDVHSYARPHEARVTHLSLDATLDFARRRLHGRVRLDLTRAPDARELVLDTKALRLHAVTSDTGQPLPFTLGRDDALLGQPLAVALPAGVERILVEYETTDACDGLLWLDAAQTTSGEPFVFSQGHAILTRSWLPTQDAIGLRQSYDARLTVPDDLTAVMSARQRTPAGVPVPGGRRFDFAMPHPIPTYLVALAAGRLEFRATGPRTGIFAEPALAPRASYEFAEMERMLTAAEAVAGPYAWERADVLVLPPSFPFGGMENPRLTFASPTLLAGDRSLATVVAHELAHAWSGNLVSPATWSDFWLNEGFTVYLELRINEALYGAERAAMLAVHGDHELAGALERLGSSSPDTRLYLDLAGRDPAEAVTPIPYLKGAALLRTLEAAVGRARFDAWLRGWFARHAYQAVTTADFVRDVHAHLLGDDDTLARRVELDRWLYEPGLPESAVRAESAVLARVEAQAAAFAVGAPAASLRTANWTAQEWRHFLGALPREMGEAQLHDLDATCTLSERTNAEVLVAWLRLAAHNAYAPALPAVERFLVTHGRGKFVRALYEALLATEWGAAEARRIFAAARPRYHTTVAGMVARLLDARGGTARTG